MPTIVSFFEKAELFVTGDYHNIPLVSCAAIFPFQRQSSRSRLWGYTVCKLLEFHSPSAGVSVTAIATGYMYTCALTSDGGLWCWGDNTFGQLGIGSTVLQTYPVAVSVGSGVRDYL